MHSADVPVLLLPLDALLGFLAAVSVGCTPTWCAHRWPAPSAAAGYNPKELAVLFPVPTADRPMTAAIRSSSHYRLECSG